MNTTTQQLVRATPQQEGVWFHAVKNNSSYWTFTNVRAYKGILNEEVLVSALREVLKRHSALLSNFRVRDGQLYQVIANAIPMDTILQRVNFEEEGETAFKKIRAAIDELNRYEFDLEQEPLLKMKFFRAGQLNILVVAVNHIITDAFSMQLFWKDLVGCYNHFLTRAEWPAAGGRQYVDFSVEQQEFMNTPDYRAHKEYWINKISAGLPVLNLPFYKDRSRSSLVHLEMELSTELVERIRSFALRNRVVYSAVLQLPFFLLLHKYTGQERVVIGNVVHGRGTGRNKNYETIGLFTNWLIQVLDLEPDATLNGLLQKLNKDLLESLAHSDIPYWQLVREQGVKTKNGAGPVFSAVFNMIKRLDATQVFEKTDVYSDFTYETLPKTDSQYDLCLYVTDQVTRIKLRLECRVEERLQALLPAMLDAYLYLLTVCMDEPGTKMSAMELCSRREKELLKKFNGPFQPNDGDQVIHEAIRSQAGKTPQMTALVFGQQRLTYQALEDESNWLAAELRKKGAGPGRLLGLLVNRSAAMIPCVLAILKSGSAYLPLDPAFPEGRLADMIRSAKPSFILTEGSLRSKLPDDASAVLAEDLGREGPAEGPANGNTSEDTAFVIYTSGSTGAPKGVMIPHGAVINFIRSISSMIDFSGKRILALTTISFDMFVFETLLPLCSGGTIVLASEAEQQDAEKASAAIIEHQVQIFHGTASRMKLLLNNGGKKAIAGLSAIILGGEEFPLHLLLELKRFVKGRIFNGWGPTETTVYSSMKELTKEASITIGGPLRNTEIFILDERRRICGVGVYGEFCIGGDGLATGYLGQPERTAERFIPHPFLPEKRIYISGDIGRWLPNGDLEISGRKDDQMKIRGYRIEPGEIEFHLKTYPGITDAVILKTIKYGYDGIHAYYTAEEAIPAGLLRHYLQQKLPAYMIPAYFIHRKEFPLTFNRKVDRKALKEMDVIQPQSLPAGQESINGQLLSLWSSILQMDNEGPANEGATSFFDLGGHSLNALHLLSRIEELFRVKISMREFFQYPTIGFLNKNINQTNEHY